MPFLDWLSSPSCRRVGDLYCLEHAEEMIFESQSVLCWDPCWTCQELQKAGVRVFSLVVFDISIASKEFPEIIDEVLRIIIEAFPEIM